MPHRRLFARPQREMVLVAVPPPRSNAIRIDEPQTFRGPSANGELATALRARRTWRRYSQKPVTLDELATVLALSAGVQLWVKGADIPIPLKTSPSAARVTRPRSMLSRRTSTA